MLLCLIFLKFLSKAITPVEYEDFQISSEHFKQKFEDTSSVLDFPSFREYSPDR